MSESADRQGEGTGHNEAAILKRKKRTTLKQHHRMALGAFSCATQFKLGALHIAPPALIWGLLSAVAFSFYTITPQRLIREYSLLPIVGWGMILGTVCSFCFYQADVSIVGGLADSILSAAEPVTSVIISTLLLHVLFIPFDLAGFVMILTAISLIAVGEHWSEKQAASLSKEAKKTSELGQPNPDVFF